MPQRIDKKKTIYQEMDSTFGTRYIRTLFKTGAQISLLSHLKESRIYVIALQARRWQGKDIMDIHTHIYSGKVNGTIQLQVAFEVVRTMNRNVLDFYAADNRICI